MGREGVVLEEEGGGSVVLPAFCMPACRNRPGPSLAPLRVDIPPRPLRHRRRALGQLIMSWCIVVVYHPHNSLPAPRQRVGWDGMGRNRAEEGRPAVSEGNTRGAPH